MSKELKNKPLVEAIFELRWELPQPHPGVDIDPGYKIVTGVGIDPDYKIVIGRMYDRCHTDYPVHQELPTARIPDAIAGYIVQHRFRTDENQWPLIQLGPGIITLNDTEGYTWEGFEERISTMLGRFLDAHPNSEDLVVNQLVLRYIDMVDFDYKKDNVFDFLRDKMKTGMTLLPSLFEETEVNYRPSELDLRFCFPCSQPIGSVRLRFSVGRLQDRHGVIWETMVQTDEKHVPREKDEIMRWVMDAHELTDDWFFKLIEGDLERRFE